MDRFVSMRLLAVTMRRLGVLAGAVLLALSAQAQQNSEYGWGLHPADTLRIMVFYVEVDYTEAPELDPLAGGSRVWQPGLLPDYADGLFDPFYQEKPTGLLSAYYREISLDNLVVLGDYYPDLITIPYGEVKSSASAMLGHITARFGSDSTFTTRHGLLPHQFDFWERSTGMGKEIPPRTGPFEGVDHVMVISRNYHRIPSDNGQASSSSSIMIAGKRSNTYSTFGGANRLPFGIMRHELNHLFLGSNNFHASGGNHARFLSYFIPVQGGWGMMGAANSSFLTCTGWDRHRLGWKAKGRPYLIGALNEGGEEADSDLDPSSGMGEGEYILRDFVTTGDVMRIKLPFIPEEEFQQWIWIENHTTQVFNSSPFDVYQYAKNDCTDSTPPGVFMQMQVDASMKEGKNIFQAVNADYLRPILANGNYDFLWGPAPVKLGHCVNDVEYVDHALLASRENPLSGNQEQEIPYGDFEEPFGVIDMRDARYPMTRRMPDGSYRRLSLFGADDHAFTLNGNNALGIGTNPSSANMLTLLNNRTPRKADPRNNRTVYLNGIRVDIVAIYPDRSVRVAVRFDDHVLSGSRRWCAPRIVLSDHHAGGADLVVEGKLSLARGLTPTRLDAPDTLSQGEVVFTDATVMEVLSGADLRVEGQLEMTDDSRLNLGQGATFITRRGSKVRVGTEAVFHLAEGSIVECRGRLVIARGGMVTCADETTYSHLRKRTCQKRRVQWAKSNGG